MYILVAVKEVLVNLVSLTNKEAKNCVDVNFLKVLGVLENKEKGVLKVGKLTI